MDTSSPAPCSVGIDVAKAHLDSAVRPAGPQWTAANDATGIGEVVARMQAVQPALVGDRKRPAGGNSPLRQPWPRPGSP